MIKFKKHQLDNGLTVIIHEDPDTPLAVVNTLYHVGSKNENKDKTGFAHLFEHLMFGGSENVRHFDEPLQKVGGDNNAFTSMDITNYYITLPAENLETALWLESDRMMALSFDPKVLEVQRKVVIEEFKQRYLNQPYGDIWLHLRPLAYQVHPYQWPTIGKEIKHIEGVTMEDVKEFFYNFYAPNNATLVVAGNVREREVLEKVNKWYSDVPYRKLPNGNIPKEPLQQEYRNKVVHADIPVDALYMAFPMPERTSKSYYRADLVSDVLGRGHSSRFYRDLVKSKEIFTSISASVTGSHDPGLLVITGRLNHGVSIEDAEKHIWEEIDKLNNGGIEDYEVEKVKNQAESTISFGEIELLNRAMGLAISTVLGNTNLINEEKEIVRSINRSDLEDISRQILRKENCSTLHYLAKS